MALICFQQHAIYHVLRRIPPVGLAAVYIVLPLAYFFVYEPILLNMTKSICYALIIFDQCFNERRLFNAGKFRFLNYLGSISYGLYIYHALVFVVLQKQFGFFTSGGWTNIAELSVTLIITGLIAHISYKYFEIKFLSLKS
jgi:peptidoglycan/LPS O-acetylase OafA/YrhL